MQTTIRHYEARETSRDSLKELITDGTLHAQEQAYMTLLALYEDDGLTDGQAAIILQLPRSTVSARRNGCMNKLSKQLGHHPIVNVDGERRHNPGEHSKTALVWRLRRTRKVNYGGEVCVQETSTH